MNDGFYGLVRAAYDTWAMAQRGPACPAVLKDVIDGVYDEPHLLSRYPIGIHPPASVTRLADGRGAASGALISRLPEIVCVVRHYTKLPSSSRLRATITEE